MTVCKFFLQGNCRFGQNCRYDHVYSSKYSYNANTATPQIPQSNAGVTDEQIVNQVISDIDVALKGGQWFLSGYKAFKEKSSFPGLTDLSPEEARLFIYEAKANNTADQAIQYMNYLFSEARSKYEQLLRPSPHMISVIKSLYRGESVSSPFDNVPQPSSGFGSTSANASSVFRSAVQPTSPFGQSNANVPTNSMFNQNSSSNIFGSQSANPAAQSIFSQANQNLFGSNNNTNSNIFGNTVVNQPSNVFSSQNTNNAFGSTHPSGNVFATNQTPANAFGTPNPADVFGQATKNVFGDSSNVFGVSQSGNTNSTFSSTQSSGNIFGIPQNSVAIDESGIYSKDEDMTPEYLEAFTSSEFKLGFIPEIPPPKALCS